MTIPEDGFSRVDKGPEVQTLLAALSGPEGASLILEDGDGRMMPVLVAEQRFGAYLLLDVSAIRDVAVELRRGRAFRLVGQTKGVMLRTPPLAVSSCHDKKGRLRCRCSYPGYVEVLERRQFFRARLPVAMEVGAIVRSDEDSASAQGDLKNLSLEGCLLELHASASPMLATALPLEIELCFPNGTRFVVHGKAKHHELDTERQAVQVGFQFETPTSEQERQLWQFVREIERESARRSTAGSEGFLRSLLFQTDPKGPPPIARRNAQSYATPMTKRLARVAGYLDAQLYDLRSRPRIDPVQLSRHTDRLLVLHDEDRDALLFALRCLHEEAGLVRHGLSVAVHLLDLALKRRMPRQACKAVAACAMVHDMGKILVPEELLAARKLSDEQRATLNTHVAKLEPCLESCRWLSASIRRSIVNEINERLDGSGYPLGLRGEQLGELSRLAMVVDVVDVMRRDRPDRPAWRVSDIYRHLLDQPMRYDQRWVRHYIAVFGLLPIGALIRFESGDLGWIQRLDAEGRPAQVQLTEEAVSPKRLDGAVLAGAELRRLGKPVAEMPVPL